MAILEKCGNCERLGGYATSESAKVCARCERDQDKKPTRDQNGRFEKNDEEDD